jgi:hypothetical protein
MNGKDGITRRKALSLGGAAGVFTFLPSKVLGQGGALAPSEKMNLAFVGCGMAGRSQVNALRSQNVVALCANVSPIGGSCFRRWTSRLTAWW